MLVEPLSYLDQCVVSPVDQLTQRTKELLKIVNTSQEVQDFTDPETEGTSLSIHFRGQQLFFPSFCRKPSRDNFVTRNLNNFFSYVLTENAKPQASVDNSTGRSKFKKHDRSSTQATRVSAWNVSLKGDGRVAQSLRCGCVVKKSLRRQRSVRGRRISKLDVCFGSGYPNETMPWIREFELAKSIDNLMTSVSNAGWSNPSFETRDARIAIAYGRKNYVG